MTRVVLLCFFLLSASRPIFGQKDVDSCNCVQDTFNSKRFTRPIYRFSYDLFSQLLPYDWIDSTEVHNNWKASHSVVHKSVLGHKTYHKGIISNTQPFLFTHPDSTFAIKLASCNRYFANYYMVRNHPVKARFYSFDYKSFDHSTASVFNLLLQYNVRSDQEMLKRYFQWYDEPYEGPSDTAIQAVFDTLKARYGIQLSLENYSTRSNFYDQSAKSALTQGLDAKRFILEQYILESPGTHRVTETELYRMGHFLSYDHRIDGKRFYERIVLLQHTLTFKAQRAGILLNPRMLNAKPKTDAQFEQAFELQTITEKWKLTLHEPFKPIVAKPCTQHAYIGGTDIILKWKGITLHSQPVNLRNSPTAPFSIDSGISALAKNFTGLCLEDAEVKIPYKRTQLIASSAHIWANNHAVLGTLTFPIKKVPKDQNSLWRKMGEDSYRETESISA